MNPNGQTEFHLRSMTMRFLFSLLLLTVLVPATEAIAEELTKATVYKDPNCGCCHNYVSYLRENGFEVEVVDTGDLSSIKQSHGVPEDLAGCHSTLVEGYVVEGHVPIAIVKRLLQEKPAISGISLPGMPLGSPGMDGEKEGPFVVYEIAKDGSPADPIVYATE
jgi:hypothetical protein